MSGGPAERDGEGLADASPPVLRPPSQVMRLERMGSFFQTRISFMRSLVRLMGRQHWSVVATRFDLDDAGYGVAVYEARGSERTYSLVAYSDYLDPAERTDRVIAEHWDATFALLDGRAGEDDVDRLRDQVRRQEAGRCSARELVLSRANKSVRLFDHVTESLAAGRQPDMDLITSVGYLMRTTAVYGNGKFGLADRDKIKERPELNGPFRAELLTVYLIRCFTFDLVEHIARRRSPATFAPLRVDIKRHLGIGNATGLGMAPFLNSHPILIHKWVCARETAIARVRAVATATAERVARFSALLARARRHLDEWNVDDARQSVRIARARGELAEVAKLVGGDDGVFLAQPYPWRRLSEWAEAGTSMETQELLISLMVELYPDRVDDLEERMASEELGETEPSMGLDALAALIERDYDWALNIDFDDPDALHFFWYVSEDKLEPRLGERFAEPGAEKEMGVGVARDVKALHAALTAAPDAGTTVAEFLMQHPEHRHVVRRIQTLANYPYGEIRDNLLGAECLAVDLLRCKLSFFGASKFDPRSDRWTRITLYQGAPLPEELSRPGADDWAFPVSPQP